MSTPLDGAMPMWHTSTYSADQNCVEVAQNLPTVLVRDTKNRAGHVLALPRSTWIEFVTAARRGEYDR